MTKTLCKALVSLPILAVLLAAMTMQSAQAVSPDIVISQVYGGGGNTGAPYQNDFVELFNRGTTTVSLSGMSVQYASATGTGNFGNNAIAQFRDLFGTLTPGARITAGLLLAVVVVSVGYLFRQGTAGPDAYLFGGEPLSDGDLTRIELAIAEANLSGHAREGNRIRVPAGRQAEFLGAIAAGGAEPANFNTIFEKALDKTSPWESREVQRERLRDARQRRLSEIVRAMPWVEEAAVIINEEEVRGLNRSMRCC